MDQHTKITDISAYRAARRRAGNIRGAMILVFFLACMFAGYFFSISSFFGIREIIVEGNQAVEAQQIIELAEIQKGENIFSVSLERAAAWIQMEPRIERAEIHRRLPGCLVIQVEERQAVACLLAGSKLLFLDGKGRVLERVSTWGSLELPLLSGVDLSSSGSLPGVLLEGKEIDAALEILNALPEDATKLGEIDVSNPQFIKIYTLSGVEIRLGDSSDFANKYLIYSNIIRDNEMERGKALNYIDVSIPDKPTLTYR